MMNPVWDLFLLSLLIRFGKEIKWNQEGERKEGSSRTQEIIAILIMDRRKKTKIKLRLTFLKNWMIYDETHK